MDMTGQQCPGLDPYSIQWRIKADMLVTNGKDVVRNFGFFAEGFEPPVPPFTALLFS